ncbi:hypothetical protein V1291_002677 [Nitrobacteraceae bacterium AZCC 1564]
MPTLHQLRRHSTQVISRRLFTGVAIITIAAGIIVGTAITVGTTVTMDGIGIITTIAITGVDGVRAPVAPRLNQISVV